MEQAQNYGTQYGGQKNGGDGRISVNRVMTS
jgi:hypothetical protein